MSPDLPSKTTTPRANPHPTHWQRFRLPNPKTSTGSFIKGDK
ncbi:unnamed protein product, partial [Musa textilis]